MRVWSKFIPDRGNFCWEIEGMTSADFCQQEFEIGMWHKCSLSITVPRPLVEGWQPESDAGV